TELEALAARTIAERGVQLVGTAHGNTLENLMMNPTLADLVGGIQTVTLSDEEARRRGTQKSVLERMAPPPFGVVVEIQDRDRVAIHPDVATAVDTSLRGQEMATETRWVDEMGEIHIEKEMPGLPARPTRERRPIITKATSPRLYLFGTNRVKLEQMAQERQLKLDVVNKLDEASLFVTTKSYYRQKLPRIKEAESLGISVYVLKHNTPAQLRQLLEYIYPLPEGAAPRGGVEQALSEAEEAIERVRGGEVEVELTPQTSYIRRLQHLLAERHHLPSKSEGREPHRRVTIYKGGR
ncbi:MAG: R3H domain-containing nucleic acid-binding protein, partial [Chloroflexota bacterium]